MDLSVIIVSWNTKQVLLACLRSVRESMLGSGLRTEVFLIDNASSDGTVDAVRTEFPEIAVTVNRENLGFAAATNIGLKFASGRYVLLLNPDTVVPAGSINRLVRFMDSVKKTAVCSPLLLNADGSPQFCWARFPGVRSELTGSLDRTQSPYPLSEFRRTDAVASMSPFPVDWVGGACFLVRQEAIHAVGPLDEGFFMFGEEVEWCYRFRKNGWGIQLEPGIQVVHLGGQSSKAVPVATRERLYDSAKRLYTILYGPAGSRLPIALATMRYLLYRLRIAYRRRTQTDPIQ